MSFFEIENLNKGETKSKYNKTYIAPATTRLYPWRQKSTSNKPGLRR